MARTRIIKTGLTLSIADGGEHELSLTIEYDFTPAFRGNRDEPPHNAAAEIVRVRLWSAGDEITPPPWLVNFVEFDKALLESLAADAQQQDASDRAEADERRAEDRADRLREEA